MQQDSLTKNYWMLRNKNFQSKQKSDAFFLDYSNIPVSRLFDNFLFFRKYVYLMTNKQTWISPR